MSRFIAVDVGAESGRLVVGALQDGKLQLEEASRFQNGGTLVQGHLYWDALKIFSEIKNGLRKIREDFGTDFASMGVDTWGCDFGLLDSDGALIGNPVCYRDVRTAGMMAKVLAKVPREDIFQATAGIQFLELNTLYQLYSMVEAESPQLRFADHFLMMPDLLNYWLTGIKACEYTNATTTQFFDSRGRDWAHSLLERLGIPQHFLPQIVFPGNILGRLSPEVGDDVGFGGLEVAVVPSHDTASAIAGVPAESDNYAWISSGTWSLMGGAADQAILKPETLKYNFSNYGGASGGVLPWKNIMGLWLTQECRRSWALKGEDLSYADLTRLASEADPFVAVIDPDDPGFFAPDDMPAAILTYCRRTGQRVPDTKGEIVRTVLEGLTHRYRWVLEKLEVLVEHHYDIVHIVGGGSQNQLLNQLTADSIGRPVIAGPVEATALGNIAVQAVATGHLTSLEEARDVIRRSTETRTFQPNSSGDWDRAYARFNELLG